MLLALKLLLAPTFIALVTLAGRRWGPDTSGLLTGLPLTSGPISLILGLQYGPSFATLAAAGSLVGQASGCLFCLAYALAAARFGWGRSAVLALATFAAATIVANRLNPAFIPATVTLIAAVLLVLRILPGRQDRFVPTAAPGWDLPARMLLAAGFVLALTTAAEMLGPHLSGLIAPFPVYGLILAVFTHRLSGGRAAAGLLRGIVLGSWAYATFFFVVGGLLLRWGIAGTYALAATAALGASALAFHWKRRARPASSQA